MKELDKIELRLANLPSVVKSSCGGMLCWSSDCVVRRYEIGILKELERVFNVYGEVNLLEIYRRIPSGFVWSTEKIENGVRLKFKVKI